MRFTMVFEVNEKDENNKIFIDILKNPANKEDIDYLVRNAGKYGKIKTLVSDDYFIKYAEELKKNNLIKSFVNEH